MRPSSATGRAPILLAPRTCTASITRAAAVIVSTALPLLRSTFKMVIALPPVTRFVRRSHLDPATPRGQRAKRAPPRSNSEPAQVAAHAVLADLPVAAAARGGH